VLAALWLIRRRVGSFWPYVLGPGSLSWAALYFGGFHPALALVPIVPFMPHSPRDLGLFDPREDLLADTLNQFEHWWATPVQFVLLLFGLANAGVPFEQVGPGTYFVLAGLLLGNRSASCCSLARLDWQERVCPRDSISPTSSSSA
jgi:NhaA family Na+:H+ antiporter